MTENNNSGILIYAQLTDEKYIHTVFFELLDKAHELSKKLNNTEISAIIFNGDTSIENYKESFQNMGVDKVYYCNHSRVNDYSTIYYSKLICQLAKDINPEILLIGATTQGRDLAPRVSCSLHTGLTADCIDLDINEKGLLAATRPTFGGELMATILCKKYPQMATVRPNVFKVHSVDYYKNTEFIEINSDIINNLEDNVQIIDYKRTLDEIINDLDNAEIIVAGGMGLKNKAGFDLLKQFANKLGATVGATRNAVEAGLASSDVQIGQTGKTVRPKLYIACGISGAIQHTVGMEGSEYIIAINNDPNAPIFNIADCGIVGDVFEILPKYLETNLS